MQGGSFDQIIRQHFFERSRSHTRVPPASKKRTEYYITISDGWNTGKWDVGWGVGCFFYVHPYGFEYENNKNRTYDPPVLWFTANTT